MPAQRQPFGVVCLRQGAEAGRGNRQVLLEDVGVLAHIEEVDAEQPGILRVRCTGGQRFRLGHEPRSATTACGRRGRRRRRARPAAPARPGHAQRREALAGPSNHAAAERQGHHCPSCSPSGWTMPAGWPTAGARLLPISAGRQAEADGAGRPGAAPAVWCTDYLRDKQVVRRLTGSPYAPASPPAGGARAPAGPAPGPRGVTQRPGGRAPDRPAAAASASGRPVPLQGCRSSRDGSAHARTAAASGPARAASRAPASAAGSSHSGRLHSPAHTPLRRPLHQPDPLAPVSHSRRARACRA
jgi:hypothetical protein